MKGRGLAIGFVFVAILAVAAAGSLTSKPQSTGVGSESVAGIVSEACDESANPGAGSMATEEWCSMEVREISLLTAGRERITFEALVAADNRTRQAGYQRIDATLVKQTATLFLFPRPLYGGFHMCNVEAPLWIVWYQDDGTPLDAQLMQPGEKMPASQCQDVYAPRRIGWYRYALEIGEELARENGLGQRELASLRLELVPWMGQGR